MTPKDGIQLSLQSYAKILCHVMQYQYTACNGVLLTADTEEEGEEEEEEEGRLEVVDVVPLFHYNLPLSPMFIVALTQIEEYAANRGMKICGYYHANEYYTDAEVGAVATRIADKIADNCERSCLLLVDNTKLASLSTEMPFRAFLPTRSNERIDWKSAAKPQLQFGDKGLSVGPEIVKRQLYQSVIDMDSHYDDVTLHWDNKAIGDVVRLFVEGLTEE